MSKFVLTKKLDLSKLADSWKGCYIEFSDFSSKEVQALSGEKNKDKAYEQTLEFIKTKFVSGKGFDGKKIIDMEKDDIDDLPMTILRGIVDFLLPKPTEAEMRRIERYKGLRE